MSTDKRSEDDPSSSTTHFGFQQVPVGEKQKRVAPTVFSSVARRDGCMINRRKSL